MSSLIVALKITFSEPAPYKRLTDRTNRTDEERQSFRVYTDRDASITDFPGSNITAD